ncbi:Nephrocystin-3 OS=Danio rerio GN=nphp3 PE=3 SV=1 [Rhizoctonia solani AG-1 IB]|nr:Nephrocystin-3 OS=Danio rerio GN=nphp3 PE=3 SV=1 [Rhizoctonia solani AG-1 IB]
MAQNSNTNAVSAVRNCPTPTSVYTGNKLKLDQTESCIAWSAAEQIVCVVHGLGGSGKTQLVLKVIERTRHKWKEVIYIDASTQRSIHDALKDVAIAKKIGNTHQSALRWLESNHSPWLLVFDGADDSSVPMRDYIPRGNHGSVIITTRLSGMVALARGPNSDCKMSSMEPEDALTLLLKCARRLDHGICDEEESARTLVKDLDYFALAVVHAGSFIGQYPHITITNYRSLLQSEQQKALGAYSNLASAVKVDDYPHTVYTAWAMCYNVISPPAQELLRLMAYLHHTGITVDIFRRAATTIMSYKSKLPSTRSEDIALKKLRTLLGPLITSYQVWDGLKFTQIIGEVVSRSLLEYDRMNQAYRMHQLVQSWVRGAAPYGADVAAECARALLSVSASSCVDESLESIMFRMSLILHVDKVVPEPPKRMGVNHAVELYDVYATKGQWKKAERLQIYVQEVCKRTLGKEHPDTLASMGNLANAYSRLGRFEDARALHTQAVNTRNRVLGRNHPDTLTSMSNLANVYPRLGRLKDAKDLNARVLNIRRPMLGSDHPDTLASMNGLANAYSKLGRNEDARALHAQALDTRKRVLGNDHPETLASMNNLANAYSWLRRSQDAMVMHNEVFDARNRVLGSDHPDTLASMNNLANAYSWLGRLEDATALHTRALDTRKRVLGNKHPDTLTSMNNLANACAKMGQFEAAAALHSQALHTRKRELGRTHPDTLRSVVNLSNAYTSLGRLKDAMVLHVEGLDACEQILGSSHPDTLASMDNLGLAYSRLGRFEDATALYTQALYRRERAPGSDHHRTLSYALHLAHQYLNLGPIQEARNLNISVDTFVRLYGENHPMTNSARNIVRKIQDPPENPIRRLFGKFKASCASIIFVFRGTYLLL